MKKLSFLLLLCFQATLVTAQKESQKHRLPDRGLCAHRGCMDTHPENTIPAFKEAIRLGAHMIEFDIQLTKDSVMVIMHDLTVDRTTDGTGKVTSLTLQQIRGLDAGVKKGDGFKGTLVPTFKEAIDIMPYNVWLNCHLKGEEEEGRLAALLLKDAGRLHQAFLTCSEKAAAGAKKAVPEVLICNVESSYRKDTPRYVKETIRLKADFIQLLRPGAGEEREELIRILKQNQVKINCFYADSPAEVSEMLRAGVDFPLVNDIASFLSAAAGEGVLPLKPEFER